MAERARALVAQADAGKLTLEIVPLIVAETLKMPVYSFDRDFAHFKDVTWKQ